MYGIGIRPCSEVPEYEVSCHHANIQRLRILLEEDGLLGCSQGVVIIRGRKLEFRFFSRSHLIAHFCCCFSET